MKVSRGVVLCMGCVRMCVSTCSSNQEGGCVLGPLKNVRLSRSSQYGAYPCGPLLMKFLRYWTQSRQPSPSKQRRSRKKKKKKKTLDIWVALKLLPLPLTWPWQTCPTERSSRRRERAGSIRERKNFWMGSDSAAYRFDNKFHLYKIKGRQKRVLKELMMMSRTALILTPQYEIVPIPRHGYQLCMDIYDNCWWLVCLSVCASVWVWYRWNLSDGLRIPLPMMKWSFSRLEVGLSSNMLLPWRLLSPSFRRFATCKVQRMCSKTRIKYEQ